MSTGVVGLGGMLITARAGRQQQRAADERAWLEYRRATYLRYISSGSAVQYRQIQFQGSTAKETSAEVLNKLWEGLRESLEVMTAAKGEVLLVAGEEVADLVQKDFSAQFAAAMSVLQNEWKSGTKFHGQLIVAMRREMSNNGKRWPWKRRNALPDWAKAWEPDPVLSERSVPNKAPTSQA